MAHINSRGEMPDLTPLHRAILSACNGKPAAEVAQAALDVTLGIWAASGDVTREMALMVVTSQIETLFTERSN